MNADVTRRIRHEVYDECRGRFVSEYGVIGPCHLASMGEYLTPADMRPTSRAFQTHTNLCEKGTTPEAIRLHYAEPCGLALKDYVLYGQMFQAGLYGRSLEALRFRKHDPVDDCQGALIWMYNDCWGETGWTIVDYYLRRKPSYYWFRRACTPLRAIVRRRGRRLLTRVVNDTRCGGRVRLSSGWLRLDGSDRRIKARRVRVPANGMVQVGVEPIPGRTRLDPREWFYAAWIDKDGVASDASTWFLLPFRQLNVRKPQLKATPRGATGSVTSNVFAHGVHIADEGRGVLSDNYFDLLPGIPRPVQRVDGRSAARLRFRAVLPKGGSIKGRM